jgi:polypeptide N-acetylgalactosaminyltransferase
VWSKISSIDENTLFLSLDNRTGGIGGFNWGMDFNWLGIKMYEGDHPTPEFEPKASPTFIGPTFALWRHWLDKIGYFDTGMDIWGGEDVEMSFRMWV